MNNKKKGVLGIIFILVILLSVTISADTCSIVDKSSCIISNRVMGLSGLTNAHGELAIQDIYPYVLCCDFTGIQSCDGTNKVLGLSAPTNAHAEIPENNNYVTDVCFADLECASNTGSCMPGYEDIPMLSLSLPTNAHLGGFNNYSTKICCKHSYSCVPDCSGRVCGPDPVCGESCGTCVSGTCNINGRCVSAEAYWANINEPRYAINYLEVIPEITKVTLVVRNVAPPNGTINFEIYESDLFIDDEIRTGADALSGKIDDSGVGLSYWTITRNDLDKTIDLGEFYFLSDSYQSGNLAITLSGGTCFGISTCSDYNEALMCDDDTCAVADDSVDESINCGEDYLCGCSWDVNNNECLTTLEPINGTSLFDPSDDFALGVGICNFNENTNDDCTDGFLTYSWIVNIKWPTDNLGWTSQGGCISAGGADDTCVFFDPLIEPNFDDKWHYDPLNSNGENSLLSKCLSGSNTLQCPAQIQLAFFTLKNFVIAIIIIGLIYIGYTLQKKNSKGKKKNRKKRKK